MRIVAVAAQWCGGGSSGGGGGGGSGSDGGDGGGDGAQIKALPDLPFQQDSSHIFKAPFVRVQHFQKVTNRNGTQ